MTLQKPAKPLTQKYMRSWVSQPDTVHNYVYKNLSEDSLKKMFVRLLIVLVSRNFLHAAELKYIVEGTYIRNTQYADWTPEQEIEDGRPIQTIRST
jgi:hypothetical protein